MLDSSLSAKGSRKKVHDIAFTKDGNGRNLERLPVSCPWAE
jgi:hypothetical protein